VRIEVIEKAKRPCQSLNKGVLTNQSSSGLSITLQAISRRIVLKEGAVVTRLLRLLLPEMKVMKVREH